MNGVLYRGMRYIAALLALGFIVITGFGFAAMNHDAGHTNPGCIASVIDNAICPKDALSIASHHLEVYQAFGNTLVSPDAVLMLLTLAVLGLLLLLLDRGWFLIIPSLAVAYTRHSPAPPKNTAKITRWLALFEHSPSW